jgi:membrane protein required for colicin V production
VNLTAGNVIDIVFGVIILFNVILGLWRGAVKEILGFVGLILSLWAASKYSPLVAAKFKSWGMPNSYGIPSITAYLSVFFAVWIVVRILIYFLNKFVKAVELGTENRLIGGAFGFAKGGTIVFFIALIMMYIPYPQTVAQKVFSSRVMQLMVQNKPKIDKAFGKGSFLDKMFPGAGETVGNTLKNTTAAMSLTAELKKDPTKIQKILDSPQVQKLKDDPKIRAYLQELIQDKDFQDAAQKKDYVKLMSNPKLQKILQDPYVRKKLLELNLQDLLNRIKDKGKNSALPQTNAPAK